MSYAVIHIEALHQCPEFDREGAHNFREYQPKNADPARAHLNQILHGPNSNLAAVVRERYKDAGTLRKDARRGVSMIISLTRDAFLGPDGKISQERLAVFTTLAMDFLRRRYRDSLISAVLHMDERTPHIHAVLVPQQANGKPAYKQTFGTKTQLRDLQTDYARQMIPMGVKRGKFNSRASHEEIDRFYKRLAEIEASIPTPEELQTPEGREQALTVMTQARAAQKDAEKERDEANERVVALTAENERISAECARAVDQWRGEYQRAESWRGAAVHLGHLVNGIRDQESLDQAVGFVREIFPPAPAPQDSEEERSAHRPG